ncbi:MAG: CinA family protein [Propionibacteriales bacterium]|nr:CinA family protein [Propionibacteriales bacterium]
MESPADELVAALRAARATLGTAESLTGGRVAARITNVPGSSAVYAGGVVSYQTQVKIKVLGVPEEIVAEHGVVSAQCARAMAAGLRELLGTTYAVSTTGVAGPERQEGKPVGTVYVGVAGPDGVRVEGLALSGDRVAIQDASVDAALSVLAAMISSAGPPPEDSGLG